MRKENILAFPANEEPEDIDTMTLSQLQAHYAAMQQELQALNDREPENMQSDLYEQWADEHEELEDYLDEILDRMEELCN